MKVVKTDENRPMTLKELEVCQQFEQSDRSGEALWWPLMAPGDPAPGCLALLEGNGRYALAFLHDQWSVRGGEWYHQTADGAVTSMGNVREDAWEAAMSVKDRLTEERGCYVIPVMVFTDMTPDPDILEEMRGSRVQAAVGPGRPGGPAGRPARRGPGAEAAGQEADCPGGEGAEPAARWPPGGSTAAGGDPDSQRRSGDGPGRR